MIEQIGETLTQLETALLSHEYEFSMELIQHLIDIVKRHRVGKEAIDSVITMKAIAALEKTVPYNITFKEVLYETLNLEDKLSDTVKSYIQNTLYRINNYLSRVSSDDSHTEPNVAIEQSDLPKRLQFGEKGWFDAAVAWSVADARHYIEHGTSNDFHDPHHSYPSDVNIDDKAQNSDNIVKALQKKRIL